MFSSVLYWFSLVFASVAEHSMCEHSMCVTTCFITCHQHVYAVYNTVARSTLTKTPINVVVEAGTDVTLECASDTSASSVRWTYDGVGAADQCSPTKPRFITTSTGNDCLLTALGNYNVQGPYTCSDGSDDKTAEAVVIVIGNPEQN